MIIVTVQQKILEKKQKHIEFNACKQQKEFKIKWTKKRLNYNNDIFNLSIEFYWSLQ